MSGAIHRYWPFLAAILAVGYLAVMLSTGALPERKSLIRSEAEGVLRLDPSEITVVTITAREETGIFLREDDRWVSPGGGAAVDETLKKLLDRAVKFMHTAPPVRLFRAEDIPDSGMAEFGLARPSVTATLANDGGVVLTAEFGNKDNDGILRYMRLQGSQDVYLMSGFVGKEWDDVGEAMTR